MISQSWRHVLKELATYGDEGVMEVDLCRETRGVLSQMFFLHTDFHETVPGSRRIRITEAGRRAMT